MLGTRGGLRDQVRAFRRFLRKKKTLRKQEELELKEKKKKEEENKEFYYEDDSIQEQLDTIIENIYKDSNVDYKKINKNLEKINNKENMEFYSKIEKVKEKVEFEILYEEIIIDKKQDIITNDKKIQKFLDLGVKNVNDNQNLEQINYYYKKVDNVYNKHKNESINVKNEIKVKNINNLINKEKETLDIITNKVNNIKNSLEIIDINILENNKKDETLNNSLVFDNESLKKEDTLLINIENDNIYTKVGINNDNIKTNDGENKITNYTESNEVVNDNLEVKPNEIDVGDLDDVYEDFDYSEFDKINENLNYQVLYSEYKVNEIRSKFESIKDLFQEKSFIDKIFLFGRDCINLGRGLINRTFFNNSLIKNLHNEILINNSLKGIHRLFCDEKKEVPYIIFKNFESEINSKRDCINKIGDICDDSLNEINNIKNDLMIKYKDLNTPELYEFLSKIDSYKNQIENRKEEVRRINEQINAKYELNKRKVLIKQNLK